MEIKKSEKGKVWQLGVFSLSLVIILAGCSSKDATKGGTASEKPSAVSSGSPVKPVEFSWLQGYIPSDNTVVQKYVEQKFNVKITPIGYDRSNFAQQINVKLASGLKPDFFGNTDGKLDDMTTWIKQGLLGEIPFETIRKYAPNYSKMIDELDKTAWNVLVVDGKNYGIPKLYGEGGSPFVPAYNETWLKKIGYDAPPKTLVELEDVLTKFRNDDPDNNGKKDTYGITARGKETLGSNQIFNTVFAAYGTSPSGWVVQSDGKVQLGIVTEEARAAFKQINKWYKAGLIDPEFVTDDWNSYRAKFANGKVGMLDQATWFHDDVTGAVGADAAKAGMKMVVGKPVIGPAGKMMGIAQGYKQVPFAIGADAAKDPQKVEAILRILEATATNKEDYMMTLHGVEGTHYDIVDGGPVSKPEFIDLAAAASAAGIGFFNAAQGNPAMLQYDYPKNKQAFKVQINDPEIIPIVDAMQMRTLPSMNANKDAFTKMTKEYELKFIIGEVDLDSGFDTYVAEMNKLGLDKATAEANEIYATILKQ